MGALYPRPEGLGFTAHFDKILYEDAGVGVLDGQTGEWILGDGTTGTANHITITGSSQSHTHDFIGSTAQGSALPLYYALTYIMRII